MTCFRGSIVKAAAHPFSLKKPDDFGSIRNRVYVLLRKFNLSTDVIKLIKKSSLKQLPGLLSAHAPSLVKPYGVMQNCYLLEELENLLQHRYDSVLATTLISKNLKRVFIFFFYVLFQDTKENWSSLTSLTKKLRLCILFQYITDPELGFVIVLLIKQLAFIPGLDIKELQLIFECFFSYWGPRLNVNRPVTDTVLKTSMWPQSVVFFKKDSIIRFAVLLFEIFHVDSWGLFSCTQKKLWVKKIVTATLCKGNYKYIIALLSRIEIIEFHESGGGEIKFYALNEVENDFVNNLSWDGSNCPLVKKNP